MLRFVSEFEQSVTRSRAMLTGALSVGCCQSHLGMRLLPAEYKGEVTTIFRILGEV